MENKNPLSTKQPSSQHGSSKITFLILIVVILLFAVGMGAYFLGINNSQSIAQPVVTTPVVTTHTQTSNLTPTGFVPPVEMAKYFVKLTVTLSNDTTITNYYSQYFFGCGGSTGKRILDNNYTPYLQTVGTVDGKTVYILTTTAPYPGNDRVNQRFIPTGKKTSFYDENANDTYVTQSEWKQFLENQQQDYPMFILKDTSGNLVMYMRQDYLNLPGC